MAKSPYRAMPSPGDDLAALRATVAAIHETVETLIGVRGPRGIANQVFTGNTAPPGVRNGDLWVQKDAAGNWTLKVFVDDKWT